MRVQGDFVSAALDSLGPELSRPAGEVSEATLNHLLRSALLSSAAAAGTASSARGEDDTVERLRARKGPAGEGAWLGCCAVLRQCYIGGWGVVLCYVSVTSEAGPH